MTRAEPETETNARSRSWAGVLILLVALYVLSIGPVEWLDRHDFLPDPFREPLVVFYTPIILLHDYFSSCRQFLDWYVDLWRG
jgi:hypothetical protein